MILGLVALAIVAAMVWWALSISRRVATDERRKQVGELARRRRWRFDPEPRIWAELRGLELFMTSYQPTVSWQASGEEGGVAFQLFDAEVHRSPHGGDPPVLVTAVFIAGQPTAMPRRWSVGGVELERDARGRLLAWAGERALSPDEIVRLVRTATEEVRDEQRYR